MRPDHATVNAGTNARIVTGPIRTDRSAALALTGMDGAGRELVPSGVILNLKGKSRSMVWLGSYIVNTSGCIECHTHARSCR